jgi:cytochrome c oxidase subunit 1
MTTPWHVLGLLGQPRRISSVQYNSLLTLAWEPYELLMILGGLVLLGSAALFVYILFKTQTGSEKAEGEEVSLNPQPLPPMPYWLNNFKLWNLVILGLMMLSYGYPILQFFILKTYNPSAWGY